MGNAFFWYYPDPNDATALAVDCGRPLGDRKGPIPSVNQSVTETLTGISTTVHYGGKAEITVSLTGALNGPGRVLRRLLYNMVNHLQRGNYVVLAEDCDFAFAGFMTKLPGAGQSVLPYYQNVFEQLNDLNNVNNRELYVQSDYQTYKTEMRSVLAHDTARRLVTIPKLTFDYHDTRWVMLRESGSWPALQLPIDKRNGELLTHDHENVFYLDLPLEEATAVVQSLATRAGTSTLPGGPPTGSPDFPGGLPGQAPPPVGDWNPAGWGGWIPPASQ